MIGRATAIVLAVALVAGVGVGAYALGHVAAPDGGDVAATRELAADAAFAKGFAGGRATGLEKGARRGRSAGRVAGRRAGRVSGTEAGSAEVERRAGVAATVSQEAAADVAAAEAAEAEALYYETHPWAAPYPSTSPPPDGSTGVAPGCYPVEGIPCD